jgi:hypothetical protein
MSDVKSPRTSGSKFSLRQLLTFTALIALGIAVGSAYQKNQWLTQQRDLLLSLSSRLQVSNADGLASEEQPELVDDFQSWQVHVPEGREYELRLGIGDLTADGIPPIVGSVHLPSGQHRVTLHTGESVSENFRYTVYVDGVSVIEKSMGSDWMPNGWFSSSFLDWPARLQFQPNALQLAGKIYEPNFVFGPGQTFSGQSDSYSTHSGYRLWIDQANRTYEPPSPFIGFPSDPQHLGFGLRDGIRYNQSARLNHWTFFQPKLATMHPSLRIEAEFLLKDAAVPSDRIQSLQTWGVFDTASGTERLQWQFDPAVKSYTAFLHNTSNTEPRRHPVVELKWDTSRPDEVGIRLADTPANEPIERWRLRILDGSRQLWRELSIGDGSWISPDQAVQSGKVTDESSSNSSTKSATVDFEAKEVDELQIRWQSDENLPLQILAQKDQRFAGMELYQGLPMWVGIQIPAALKPSLTVEVADQHPTIPGTNMPGGSVFDVIQVGLAAEHDWIWLSVMPKDASSSASPEKLAP